MKCSLGITSISYKFVGANLFLLHSEAISRNGGEQFSVYIAFCVHPAYWNTSALLWPLALDNSNMGHKGEWGSWRCFHTGWCLPEAKQHNTWSWFKSLICLACCVLCCHTLLVLLRAELLCSFLGDGTQRMSLPSCNKSWGEKCLIAEGPGSKIFSCISILSFFPSAVRNDVAGNCSLGLKNRDMYG